MKRKNDIKNKDQNFIYFYICCFIYLHTAMAICTQAVATFLFSVLKYQTKIIEGYKSLQILHLRTKISGFGAIYSL